MFDVIGRLAACFTDHRDPSRVEHTLEAMLRQRVYAICLGYEDVNDHDRLRDDPVLAMGVGCEDVTGAHRARERDQGHPLASSSTLNRLELGSKEGVASHRYKRIVADPEKIDTMLADLFMDVTGEEPENIVLDLDATDDAIHGKQEGRFFHGYYGHYCYLPLYIVSGKHVLTARLRPSNIDASAGTIEELAPVVARIRARWPQVPIWIRADAGFCRDDIMAWCEAQGLHYIIGMPRNERLQRIVEEAMQQSQATCEASGQPSRRFRSFEYRTKESARLTGASTGSASLPLRMINHPRISSSRAFVPVRVQAKRRQRRVWAGLMSTERRIVRDAEAFSSVEGNTFFAAQGEAEEGPAVSENPCTHVRTAPGPGRSSTRPAVVRGRKGKALAP